MAEIKIYTLIEVAEKLRVSDDTILRAIKKGELDALKIASCWRITSEQLEAYLDLRTVSFKRSKKLKIA